MMENVSSKFESKTKSTDFEMHSTCLKKPKKA
jgi:hypothetical protein